MVGHRPEARYASSACRTRAWKVRAAQAAEQSAQASRNARVELPGVVVYLPVREDAARAVAVLAAAGLSTVADALNLALRRAGRGRIGGGSTTIKRPGGAANAPGPDHEG
jgi:hypothetical protein